ncbi:hypothetical protein KPC83_05875 [Collinsella sp. zg1085]|uniref:hypothetical protein n=1 Tax=Collinsella sp. zg1085 TaxID=2844380 RepID=UPI001C0CF3C0|nr:hypothetical protein [Collinsella sp. zg1085]QWT17365.1 hypothetical protein KPC83_05875 [Collinsella sp. zg1085]
MEFAFLILAALLFFFAMSIGFKLGESIGTRAVTTKDYILMNVVAIVGAVLVSIFVAPYPLLYAAVIGALSGGIVGLKMAFGESVGPWKVHDKLFNVNKSHRETEQNGTGEARRKRRLDKAAAPQLMSIETPRSSDTDMPRSQSFEHTPHQGNAR